MGGFNYSISQQNLKITGARERIVPNVSTPATALTKNTNHFVIRLVYEAGNGYAFPTRQGGARRRLPRFGWP